MQAFRIGGAVIRCFLIPILAGSAGVAQTFDPSLTPPPVLVATGDSVPGFDPASVLLSWDTIPGVIGLGFEAQSAFDSTFAGPDSRTERVSMYVRSIHPGRTFGTTYWRVRAIMSDPQRRNNYWGPWSVTYAITNMDALPILDSPENLSHFHPLNLAIRWYPYPSAKAQLQVSEQLSDFTALVVDSVFEHYVANVTLRNWKTYYWRIRYALYGGGFSPWSLTWSFATRKADMYPVDILGPPDNTLDVPDSVFLKWNDANEEGYSNGQVIRHPTELQLTTDSTFPDVGIWVIGLSASPYRTNEGRGVYRAPYLVNGAVSPKGGLFSPLQYDMRYFWRVRAAADIEPPIKRQNPQPIPPEPDWVYPLRPTGPWSEARSFRTMKKPPVSLAMTYPANGAADVESTLVVKWHDTLSDSAGGLGYRIELRLDSNFNLLDSAYLASVGPPVKSPGLILANSAADSIAVTLPAGKRIYWHLQKNLPAGVRMTNYAEGSFTTTSAAATTAIRSMTQLDKVCRSFSVFGRDGTVSYELTRRAHVSLRLYDLKGRLAGAPIEAAQGQGRHLVSLSSIKGLEPGWYYLVFKSGDFHQQARYLIMH